MWGEEDARWYISVTPNSLRHRLQQPCSWLLLLGYQEIPGDTRLCRCKKQKLNFTGTSCKSHGIKKQKPEMKSSDQWLSISVLKQQPRTRTTKASKTSWGEASHQPLISQVTQWLVTLLQHSAATCHPIHFAFSSEVSFWSIILDNENSARAVWPVTEFCTRWPSLNTIRMV